ncbi:MAG: tRNA (adenosine(37)-N6)-threonylcarbamoyltransferase complex dimerization subunit type 1 TsaB [Pseudomonadota bacterium]
MIVLALHTAGPACDIAVVDQDRTLSQRCVQMARGQDAELPGLVQQTLAAAGLALDQIDRFAVISGPGSFTGIRVGVAFARGLALAVEKPCLGVTTLEAALPIGQQGSAIVALPAQNRPPDLTFWTQTFRTGAATGTAQERSAEALQTLLQARPHMLFGEVEALRPHFPDQSLHAAQPSAERAAQVALTLDPDTRTARPTYARAPDAALPKPKA